MTARIDGDFRLIDRICDRCKEPTTFDSEDPYGTDKRDCFFVNVAGLQVGMEDLCYRCRDEVVKTIWALGFNLHRDPYYALPRTEDRLTRPEPPQAWQAETLKRQEALSQIPTTEEEVERFEQENPPETWEDLPDALKEPPDLDVLARREEERKRRQKQFWERHHRMERVFDDLGINLRSALMEVLEDAERAREMMQAYFEKNDVDRYSDESLHIASLESHLDTLWVRIRQEDERA